MAAEGTRGRSGTTISAALVVKVDFEVWPDIKRAIEELGATIVFQKVAPPYVRLEIVEREPPEVRP